MRPVVSRPPRPTIDLSALRPDELAALPDERFWLVVDADVKRSQPRAQPVPAWVAAALRTTLQERWYTTLRRMLASVDGQLEAKDSDYEAEKAKLALRGDERKIEELNVRHFETRSRSLRFRSGLRDSLVEAEGLRNSRVAHLEEAIRAHRDAIGDADATDADRALWDVLGSFTK